MRDLLLYLEDILAGCAKIDRYTGDLSEGEFRRDELVIDGVLRNLGVIGEAVKAVPDEMRQRHPEVEWRRIAGLRDMVVHVYFGVDLETIWDVVQNKIPALAQDIRRILENERAGEHRGQD